MRPLLQAGLGEAFVGGDRFLAAIGLGIRGIACCGRSFRFGWARLFVGGDRFLAAIGLGVRGIGCCGRSFRLGCFSLGCFSLILPSLGQQTLTKNAHGANWRIEFGCAGCFANCGFWRRCRMRIQTRRLLWRRRSDYRNRRAPAALILITRAPAIGHFRGEIG